MSESLTFQTTVGEQVYFSQWYWAAQSRSHSMWLVPLGLLFAFCFSYSGIYWLLSQELDFGEPISGEFVQVISLFAGLLATMSMLVAGFVLMGAQFYEKRVGSRSVFDISTKQEIRLSLTGVELTDSNGSTLFPWSVVSHVVVINGALLVGAQQNFVGIPQRAFTSSTDLRKTLRVCRERTRTDTTFTNISFRKPYAGQSMEDLTA